MKIKLIHPLWTHIPVVLALIAVVVNTIRALPLPSTAPLTFTEQWGSPLMSVISIVGISIAFMCFSIVFDEMWARAEKRKTFHWLSLVDDVAVAVQAAVQITYVNMWAAEKYVYSFPWAFTLIVCGLAAGLAIILEKMRPFTAYKASSALEDVSQTKAEVARIMKAGQALAYWEVQYPTYFNVAIVTVTISLFSGAVQTWADVRWLSIYCSIVGVLSILLYGGTRILVTREAVTFKWGLLGIVPSKLKTRDNATVELIYFKPTKYFGRYGIGWNKELKAYSLSRDRGVKIMTRAGKMILTGADHPERLAMVISNVIS